MQKQPRDPQALADQASPRAVHAMITRWRVRGIAAFCAIMVVGALIGLLFFLRPTTSAVEMRNLTKFPEFTVESFLNGEYFTQVSLWYADTYPLREPMVAADHAVDGLFGISTGTGMIGGNVKADEIPTADGGQENRNLPSGDVLLLDIPQLVEAPDERVVTEDIQKNIMSGVYITNGAGFSIYYFSQYAADTYVKALNTAADRLEGVATVYSVMAPANSITLSDEQALALGGTDQQQALDYLSSRYDKRVKAVDLVDTIKAHRDEYLYFRTDHHWTQLGAYYGYVEFCKAKGITPKPWSGWNEVDLGEFRGTYYDSIEEMGPVATDDIVARVPNGTNEMTYWNDDGEQLAGKVVNEEAASWEAPYKYSAYILGDQPLEIIHNPQLRDGSSCLVVKDSYGCAFVPQLVDHYETVHVIDFRKTDENLVDYVKANGVQDVIFMTGMKIGLTDSVAQMLLSEVS